VAPPAGLSPAALDSVRVALRELGVSEEVTQKVKVKDL